MSGRKGIRVSQPKRRPRDCEVQQMPEFFNHLRSVHRPGRGAVPGVPHCEGSPDFLSAPCPSRRGQMPARSVPEQD
jgi:hypothetical protein